MEICVFFVFFGGGPCEGDPRAAGERRCLAAPLGEGEVAFGALSRLPSLLQKKNRRTPAALSHAFGPRAGTGQTPREVGGGGDDDPRRVFRSPHEASPRRGARGSPAPAANAPSGPSTARAVLRMHRV